MLNLIIITVLVCVILREEADGLFTVLGLIIIWFYPFETLGALMLYALFQSLFK